MKRFAKLISDKQIELAPVLKDGIINFNLNENIMRSYGYKEIAEADVPTTGIDYEIIYSEDDSHILETVNYLETEDEFEKRLEKEKAKAEIDVLNTKIQEIDLKRIRAICEPEIKDEDTGETWLDYYNNQISEIRIEIQKLQERIN